MSPLIDFVLVFLLIFIILFRLKSHSDSEHFRQVMISSSSERRSIIASIVVVGIVTSVDEPALVVVWLFPIQIVVRVRIICTDSMIIQ